MTESPKIFISFSSRDQNEVRKLFSALHHQNIEVWDYSDDGQELPLAYSLEASLKRKIDECDYFIAVISRNSVHEEIGRHTRFEVFYALEKKLDKQNRILPLVIKNSDEESIDWLNLYKDFKAIKYSEIDFADGESLEDGLREICGWLSISYIPSSLRDKKVFFAPLFLEEVEETIGFSTADFVQLMKVMNDCANFILEENWEKAWDRIRLFLMLAETVSPPVRFHYPIIVRGICEFQLKELELAKQTLSSLTQDPTCKNERILGLGLAALGQIYVSQEEYETALEFYEKAAVCLPKGKDISINKIHSLSYTGATSWDETILGEIDDDALCADNLLKIIRIKGIVNYRKGDFYSAIENFRSITSCLDECAAIYYGLSLAEVGLHESAIDVLSFAAKKLNSANIYHHLANMYIGCECFEEAADIYDRNLCKREKSEDRRRQFFIEYARLLRYLDTETNQQKICDLCKTVLDFNSFSYPQTDEDFFYMGYANFLLGNNDLARYDFDRSAGFCEKYYDEFDF